MAMWAWEGRLQCMHYRRLRLTGRDTASLGGASTGSRQACMKSAHAVWASVQWVQWVTKQRLADQRLYKAYNQTVQ